MDREQKATAVAELTEDLKGAEAIFALEAVTRHVLSEGDEGRKVSPAAVERARRVMVRMISAGFAGTGPGVTTLPLADD